jgi:hypothetical protein
MDSVELGSIEIFVELVLSHLTSPVAYNPDSANGSMKHRTNINTKILAKPATKHLSLL